MPLPPPIYTLDLNFLGQPDAIASYLIPHAHGAILIETGPGSTLPALQAALKTHGLSVANLTDAFLTHIHLDHAGASGWLARQGVRIHLHPNGAPHMLNPEKLITSATRIYGDKMETLWGEFLPVPPEQLNVMEDNAVVEIGGLRIRAINTPGHANHHYAYIVGDVCFSGDVGGIRLSGMQHLRLPTPPPEFHLETWRATVERLQNEYAQGHFTRIAPTHFGIFDDAGWHLHALHEALQETEQWMLTVMPADPSAEQLLEQFIAWANQRAQRQGLDQATIQLYETANPSKMSSLGIQRYWRKFRQPPTG